LAAWNDLAGRHGLAVARKLTDARRTRIRRRLADCDGLAGWFAALERIAASPGLLGANDRGWKADLDFVLQESSFQKLIEGRYDDWGAARQQENPMAGVDL
jgi:hypothetical protein